MKRYFLITTARCHRGSRTCINLFLAEKKTDTSSFIRYTCTRIFRARHEFENRIRRIRVRWELGIVRHRFSSPSSRKIIPTKLRPFLRYVCISAYTLYIYIRYRYNTCACIYVHRQKGKERKEREREKRRKRRKRGIKSKKRKTRLGSPVFVGAGGSCLGVITPSFRDFNKREDE